MFFSMQPLSPSPEGESIELHEQIICYCTTWPLGGGWLFSNPNTVLCVCVRVHVQDLWESKSDADGGVDWAMTGSLAHLGSVLCILSVTGPLQPESRLFLLCFHVCVCVSKPRGLSG